MRNALIGYTGFVGQSLNHDRFTDLINSENIKDYAGQKFDLLVVAAGDARKWYANQNPVKDMLHVLKLFKEVVAIQADRVILVSTVDVYQDYDANFVYDEDSIQFNNAAYGLHRLMLEKLISSHYNNVSVVRLPGLFGKGLKKNIIFDICNNRMDQIVNYHLASKYQYFDMSNFDNFIDLLLEKEYPVLNISTEPVSIEEIFACLNVPKDILSNNGDAVSYNVVSKYVDSGYFYSKHEVLDAIEKFYKNYE